MKGIGGILAIVLVAVGLMGCERPEEDPVEEPTEHVTPSGTGDEVPETEATLRTNSGVDADAMVIRIGILNDESGPAAAIGRPFAAGKRVLAELVNAGGSGILPDGWTVELIERDHGYNPQRAVEVYNEIKNDILFIGTSFGTPNTLPLRSMLENDVVMAFPASLSSQLADHTYTPPIGPSYLVEAMRAMDWVVESTEDPSTIQAGIVYQRDDYGQDGLDGWTAAAAHHGVTIVSEQTVAPGQSDMVAVVQGLEDAGATHVLLTTLPSATGPILGTAAQLGYNPVWIGNTPAWVDAFFSPEVIPSQVFARYYQMSGFPYWGEDVPGMDAFLAAWDAHGGELGDPDFYILVSYIQGLVQLEAARLAIEAGDIRREGYRTALQSLQGYDAGGLLQPLDLSGEPYVTSMRTRVLRPAFEQDSWFEEVGFAEPLAPAP